ncbi:MAG: hypothetical protein IJ622_05715 [Bacteroidales bacterium]|nr:hypothetical protein [Bacteroidales bacterium]
MKNKHPVWTKLDWRGPRPLTLRELILKSNFDTMMDIIVDFDLKMSNQGGAFLKAYHYIRDMKLKPHSEDYFLAQYDRQYDVPYIGVLEGIRWSEYLGYQVKRDKDLHCNDTVLAAHCLWHLTFYGYTPEEQRANFDRQNEELERERRNDEIYLADDIYTDEEIKESARLGYSRVRDEVLERLFTPEEIIEIKKIHKKRLDEENARFDAADEEEKNQKEQEAAMRLEMRKKAEQEKREEWYRKQRRKKKKLILCTED